MCFFWSTHHIVCHPAFFTSKNHFVFVFSEVEMAMTIVEVVLIVTMVIYAIWLLSGVSLIVAHFTVSTTIHSANSRRRPRRWRWDNIVQHWVDVSYLLECQYWASVVDDGPTLGRFLVFAGMCTLTPSLPVVLLTIAHFTVNTTTFYYLCFHFTAPVLLTITDFIVRTIAIHYLYTQQPFIIYAFTSPHMSHLASPIPL